MKTCKTCRYEPNWFLNDDRFVGFCKNVPKYKISMLLFLSDKSNFLYDSMGNVTGVNSNLPCSEWELDKAK